MRIQGWRKAMAATHMRTTPVATVRAALSLTGFGNLNTHIVYWFRQVLCRADSPPAAHGTRGRCPTIRFRTGFEYSHVMAGLEEASDANLVVGVGRWHEPALAEIYRRHGGSVHVLARRIVRSDPPAEEITQEVFLDLWDRPEKFDAQRGTLRSFLLARTHGKSVDFVRSEVARRRREERTSRETATAPYDIDHECGTWPWPSRSKRPSTHCPTSSASPSNWPTSVATPIARSQ